MPRPLIALARRFDGIAALALVGLSLLAAPVARADDPEATRSAIAHAERGELAFAAGRYDEAFNAFFQANGALPAPTVLARMGDCKRQLGRLVQARAIYQKVSDWTLPVPAPPPWREAQGRAREEIAKLDRSIARVAISIDGEDEDDVLVTIDGAKIDSDRLGEVLLDPGPHQLVAKGPSETLSRSIDLDVGAERLVELTFGGGGGGPRLTTPSLIAYAVGGAALTCGVVSGIATIVAVAELDKRCQPDNHCPAADQGEADAAYATATLSTASFVIAGIATAAGVALMWLPEAAATEVGMRPRLVVGPSGGSLTLSF